MPIDWAKMNRDKLIDAYCVTKEWGPASTSHYHTRDLKEADKEWYTTNGWAVSRFCQKPKNNIHAKVGDPQDWQDSDD